MCINPNCIEPLCIACVEDHINLHMQLGSQADIHMIKDVGELYTGRLGRRREMMDDSYTRVMASGIVKGYLDDFFRNNFQVDDRNMVSYRDDVKKGKLDSLIKAVSQDLKCSVDSGFKDRLH